MSRRFLSSSLLHLSFSVTPHIHLIIILSALSSLRISSALIGHVSLPYTITLCTHILYNFPFNLKETPPVVSIGPNLLKLIQALLTLFLLASSAPPLAPITSPR